MNLKERIFWLITIFSIFLSIAFADLQIRTSLTNSTAYLKNLVLTNNGLTNGTTKINLDGGVGNISMSGNLVAGGNIQAPEVCIAGDCQTTWPGLQWNELLGNVYRATGNVGIGTNSPTTALDVVGSIKASGWLTVAWSISLPADSITSAFIKDNSILSADIKDAEITSTDIKDATITKDDIALETIVDYNISTTASIDGTKILSNFGSQNLIVNGNTLFVDYASGSVGIGTSLPASELDVRGVIHAMDICDENWANCIDISSGWPVDYSLNSYWWTYNNVVYVDNLANVWIGTTLPAYKLDINGELRLQDIGIAGTPNLIVWDDAYITDIDQANFLWIYGQQNSTVGGIALGWINSFIYGNSGGIGIWTTSPNAKLDIIGVSSSPVLSIWDTTNPLSLYIMSNAGGWYPTINSTSGLWLYTSMGKGILIDPNGNVGIGVSSPTYNLDINWSVRTNWIIEVERNLGTTPSTNLDDTILFSAKNLDKSWDTRILDIAVSPTNTAIIRSVWTDLWLIGGNVGIWTTIPSETLEVNGNAKVNGYLFVNATRYNWANEQWRADMFLAASTCNSIRTTIGYSKVIIGLDGESCSTTCSGDSFTPNCLWGFFLNAGAASGWISSPLIYNAACSYSSYVKYCCCSQ